MGSRPWGGDRARTDFRSFGTRTATRSEPGIVFGGLVRSEKFTSVGGVGPSKATLCVYEMGCRRRFARGFWERPSRGSADTIRGFG